MVTTQNSVVITLTELAKSGRLSFSWDSWVTMVAAGVIIAMKET